MGTCCWVVFCVCSLPIGSCISSTYEWGRVTGKFWGNLFVACWDEFLKGSFSVFCRGKCCLFFCPGFGGKTVLCFSEVRLRSLCQIGWAELWDGFGSCIAAICCRISEGKCCLFDLEIIIPQLSYPYAVFVLWLCLGLLWRSYFDSVPLLSFPFTRAAFFSSGNRSARSPSVLESLLSVTSPRSGMKFFGWVCWMFVAVSGVFRGKNIPILSFVLYVGQISRSQLSSTSPKIHHNRGVISVKENRARGTTFTQTPLHDKGRWQTTMNTDLIRGAPMQHLKHL